MKIAVLMACHNRRNVTLCCLHSLVAQEIGEDLLISVFLVDDGSTDGTASAIGSAFPDTTVIAGTGELYWCGGMRLAWRTAIDARNFDAFLWLNDDVRLFSAALASLVEAYKSVMVGTGHEGIIVGSTKDPSTGRHTYGGLLRLSCNCVVLPDETKPRKCETMNGNIVLVPAKAVNQIGILSSIFQHSMGDIDYGLRATKTGIPVYVAPGYQGECSNNPGPPKWADPAVPIRRRLQYLRMPTGLPPRQYFHYCRRHYGVGAFLRLSKLWARVLFPSAWGTKKGEGGPNGVPIDFPPGPNPRKEWDGN